MAKKKEVQEESLEKQLWKSADKLRKNIDAAEYKHVVLGLIFLKYISDAFEELYATLKAGEGEYAGADPEDKDEYKAENIFFVPQDARWAHLQAHAKQPTIGKTVDEAMDAIEKENASLKGVLPKAYARQNLDPTSLGELIDLISNITVGDAKSRSADVLGHVFEYFPGEFALAKGALTSKTSGEGEIRKALVEAGLIDCIVNLPAKLFLNTQIPASLWFLSRNRANGALSNGSRLRNRTNGILFIDTRNMGHLINCRTRELSAEDIQTIAGTYHNWRNPDGGSDKKYEDIKGFCSAASIERVKELDYVLTPGRYVGLAEEEDDFDFAERFTSLKAEFESQLKEEVELNQRILENLTKVKVDG